MTSVPVVPTFFTYMANILLLETLTQTAEALLHKHHYVMMADAPDKGMEIAKIYPVDAIVTRGKGKVDQELIHACKGLKLIARAGVGLDNVDVDAATQHGVKVLNAPGSNAGTIAEHAVSLMLMLVRNMYHSVEEVKKGNWAYRTQMQCDELGGKHLAVLGLGNIGSRVAKLGDAFGMEVMFWDKFLEDAPYEKVSLEYALSHADVISIHLPLLPDTEGLIGEKELFMMKPSAVLINTARGPVIDQKALREALASGQLGGFAADVLAKEPPDPDDTLLQFPNVLVTPHAGSLTATTYRYMCQITAENVVAWLDGKKIDEYFVFNR